MRAEEKARELGYSKWIIDHFKEFKDSLEMYNQDEMAELMVLFLGPTILWSLDASKRLVETAKYCGYENRIAYMQHLLKGEEE